MEGSFAWKEHEILDDGNVTSYHGHWMACGPEGGDGELRIFATTQNQTAEDVGGTFDDCYNIDLVAVWAEEVQENPVYKYV